MVEQDNMKAYIANMNKIINAGNPKYLAYVCKEFASAKKNNPVLANILENIILKESHDKDSCYRILIDTDNKINLDALYDISKIQNVPDFIKKVDALSSQDIDFKDLTGDELIIEGMDIAEELANEVDSIDSNLDSEEAYEAKVEEVESKVEDKTGSLLGKAAVGVGIFAILKNVISKMKVNIKSSILRVKDKAKFKKEQKDDIKNDLENKASVDQNKGTSKKETSTKSLNNSFIQKVDVDEEKAIANMKSKDNSQKAKIRQNSMPDDGFNDTSDDDFDDNNDDDNNDNNGSDNNGIEDDEPDI